jgi:acyl dehydratase
VTAIIEVGAALPEVVQETSLETAVRYAGASGDLNPLHYDPQFAARVSPTGGLIVHGMFAMGLASRALSAFAGGPDRVVSIEVRFTRPWPLGESATFGGSVTAVDGGVAKVALWGETAGGTRILRGTGRVRV